MRRWDRGSISAKDVFSVSVLQRRTEAGSGDEQKDEGEGAEDASENGGLRRVLTLEKKLFELHEDRAKTRFTSDLNRNKVQLRVEAEISDADRMLAIYGSRLIRMHFPCALQLLSHDKEPEFFKEDLKEFTIHFPPT